MTPFAFLTNAIVAPIHAEAMPVILTTQEEIDAWMTALTPKTLPLASDGEREPQLSPRERMTPATIGNQI